MKKSELIFVGMVVIFSLFMAKCNLSRSTLIDHNIAIECKILLEESYLTQKTNDKAFLITLIQKCGEANKFLRCEKYIENRTLWEACNGSLK